MKLLYLTLTLLLASLFTVGVVKGQECEPELNALNACTGTDIEDSTAVACHLCVIMAPDYYHSGVYSCDNLQDAYCNAVDICGTAYTCGACIAQMEPLVGCILNNHYSTLGGCNLISCGSDGNDFDGIDSDGDADPCVGSAGLCINGLLDCCSGLICENSMCAVPGSGGTSIGLGSFTTYICLLGLALLWV